MKMNRSIRIHIQTLKGS